MLRRVTADLHVPGKLHLSQCKSNVIAVIITIIKSSVDSSKHSVTAILAMLLTKYATCTKVLACINSVENSSEGYEKLVRLMF